MTIADFISENEKQMVKTDIKIQLAVQRDIQTKNTESNGYADNKQ